MQRITITVDDDLLVDIDDLIKARGYQNRSEAIRDLVRSGLQDGKNDKASGECVGALVYVYDHAARNLSHKLVENAHHHHDVAVATMHVHLDDASCLEVTALKGTRQQIHHFADHVIAERGVRYGRAVVIPSPAVKSRRGKISTAKSHRH